MLCLTTTANSSLGYLKIVTPKSVCNNQQTGRTRIIFDGADDDEVDIDGGDNDCDDVADDDPYILACDDDGAE